MIQHSAAQISDEELVRQAQRGDRSAFDELVRRFRGVLLAVAERSVGSRDAAEDVAQDAFLQAFRALPQLQDPAKFGHWLCVIARCRARRLTADGSAPRKVPPSSQRSRSSPAAR